MSQPDSAFTDKYQYRIEPIYGESPQDPEVAASVAEYFSLQGIALDPLLSILVGWQLQLRVGGVEVELREFAGGETGYQEAQRAGGAWMEQHDVNASIQWVVEAAQALQRMTWDEDYRRKVGRRIS